MKNQNSVCLIGATLALSLFTFGCATTGSSGSSAPPVAVGTNGLVAVFGHDIQPQAMETALKVASQAGTIAALHYDKNSRAYLQAAQVVFDAAINNGQYDPAVLGQSLSNISIKEAHDPNVTAGIEAAFGTYSLFFGGLVTAKVNDVSPYALPALTGLRDGIAAGLSANPAPGILIAPNPVK